MLTNSEHQSQLQVESTHAVASDSLSLLTEKLFFHFLC